MVDIDETKIVTKGRLGPGEIIGVRIKKGKVYTNNEIKKEMQETALLSYMLYENGNIIIDEIMT